MADGIGDGLRFAGPWRAFDDDTFSGRDIGEGRDLRAIGIERQFDLLSDRVFIDKVIGGVEPGAAWDIGSGDKL